MEGNLRTLTIPASTPAILTSLKVEVGTQIRNGTLLATYTLKGPEDKVADVPFKSTIVGKIHSVLHEEGDTLQPSEPLFCVEERCDHSIVVFDMCADCGLNLRRNSSDSKNFPQQVSASVSMIHGIPELRVSQKEAKQLGNKDRLRLLTNRKLALIVDLDQTLVHTSLDPNIEPGLPDVYGFHLPDHHLLYHCRLRPYTRQFLEKVSELYELHVFTMGTKSYAAGVTNILDPERRLFCDRIISRDECFNSHSKVLRLKSVFPCGDSMVAIIDDREDVWGRSPNLVHVKPYVFFSGTTDINAPPPHPTRPHLTKKMQSGKGSHSFPTHVPFKTRNIVPKIPRKERKQKTYEESCTGINGSGIKPVLEMKNDRLEPEVLPDSKSDGDSQVETDSSTIGLHSGIECGGLGQELNSGSESRTVIGTSSDVTLAGKGSSLSEVKSENPEVNIDPSSSGVLSETLLININGTNNNNNNESKGDKDSSSDVSSSDSDESSSSGIDDTLFDQPSDYGAQRSDDGEQGPEIEERRMSFLEEGESNNIDKAPKTVDSSELPSSEMLSTPITHSEITLPQDNLSGMPPTSITDKNQENSNKKRLHEIKDPDDFLLHLSDILSRIHRIFYERYDVMVRQSAADVTDTMDLPIPDLKQIIPELRQSILKDSRVLFTGVIPTNIPARKNPEWNTARAFGATIHNSLVPGLNSSKEDDVQRATTHVIAGKPGTSKLLEAKQMPGIKIVNPKWLWACAERWKKVNEENYPVEFEKHQRKRGCKARRGSEKKEVDDKKDLECVASESSIIKPLAESSESSSDSDEDNIFKKTAFTDLAKMDTTEVKRHLSMESRLSVSDEELERMEAEVEAEISSSNESDVEGEKERLGSHIEHIDNCDELSYEKFAGTHASQDIDVLERMNRKRKFAELEPLDSKCAESLNESFASDDDLYGDSGDGDEDDELGALLGFSI